MELKNNVLKHIADFTNENQGLVTVGIFFLGIIGFFIKKLFFSENQKTCIQKQKSGNNSINIQSGRDTNYGSK